MNIVDTRNKLTLNQTRTDQFWSEFDKLSEAAGFETEWVEEPQIANIIKVQRLVLLGGILGSIQWNTETLFRVQLCKNGTSADVYVNCAKGYNEAFLKKLGELLEQNGFKTTAFLRDGDP